MATDTRERLIRTTGRLLRTQGYAATGLNEIMRAADAPKGSMYFHFPGGKEQLAAEAVGAFADRGNRGLEEILAESATMHDLIHAIFDVYIEHLQATDYREGCAVATVSLDAAAGRPVLAEATDQAFRGWVDRLAEGLEARGRSPQESHALATLIIAAVEGTIMMAKGERSTEPVAAARDALLKAVARAPVTVPAG